MTDTERRQNEIPCRYKEVDAVYGDCLQEVPPADEYVSDIFGNHYRVIDHVDRLPERLPQLFMSLTK